MAILGNLLKGGIKLTTRIQRKKEDFGETQRKTLSKLLAKARYTQFGEKYNFDDILNAAVFEDSKNYYEKFKRYVPVHNYEKIYREWWYKAREGEKNVCWPGKVKYFALSSGTSEAASKYIPVTKAMTKSFRNTSIRQILSLGRYEDLPSDLYEKSFLMVGGSSDLTAIDENRYEGDVSGINAKNIPFWFEPYYKPGREIARERDWSRKLEMIVEEAPNWDIGFMAGVPAWLQIIMEKIIERYNLDHIHDIWPNLTVFGHGGVSFEPYRAGFEKLLGRPLIYIDTYLASEGFIAFQNRPNADGMRLVLDNGIFYEFVPFNEKNFNDDGELLPNPQTFMIDEVQEGVEYALLLSTCSGAWRYLIGDTVKFVNKSRAEIAVTGRTKHYLSLCGEHLSIENMNKAIELTAAEMGITVKEFTVAGIKYDSLFAHHWYIGTDDPVDANLLKEKIDNHLKVLNDDYVVERRHALKEVFVTPLPSHVFLGWLERKGKMGGQNKFPRVLKKNLIADWEEYLQSLSVGST
ncbi:MAG: GH3 auxin-responsive promoter family protein [Runella sp.]